jgi:very-short-patch-repair endonuclease
VTPLGVLRLRGGQATTAEILGECSRKELAANVRAGTLLRARRGVYVLPALLDPLQVAARVGGVASHQSAAQILGFSLVEPPTEVHVTLPRHGRHPRLPGVRVHWARSLNDADVVDGYTQPLRTVLDCSTTLPFAQALAIADSALSLSEIGAYELRSAAARSPARGRGRRQRVADASDDRPENAFESALRALALEVGLVAIEPQVLIVLPRRKVRVDLADRARRLVIEADSYTYHGTRAAFRADCDRYNELVAARWTVLRFTWEHVMLRPDAVRRAIRETVAQLDGSHPS